MATSFTPSAMSKLISVSLVWLVCSCSSSSSNYGSWSTSFAEAFVVPRSNNVARKTELYSGYMDSINGDRRVGSNNVNIEGPPPGLVQNEAVMPSDNMPSVGFRERGASNLARYTARPTGSGSMQRYNPRTGQLDERAMRISPHEMYSPGRHRQQQGVFRDDFSGATSISGGTVQGGSRNTWSSDPFTGRQGAPTLITMQTDGRPLEGEFELWEGPGNTPQKVRVFSQDGHARPFQTIVHPRAGQPHSMSVRNIGPMEFPMRAHVQQVPGHGRVSTEPYRGRSTEHASPPVTVQGGSLKTFTVGHGVQQVLIELTSQGMPIEADIELWEGPGQARQIAQVYNDDGAARPFSAVLDTSGWYGATIAIRNTGMMTSPITASVSPYS